MIIHNCISYPSNQWLWSLLVGAAVCLQSQMPHLHVINTNYTCMIISIVTNCTVIYSGPGGEFNYDHN